MKIHHSFFIQLFVGLIQQYWCTEINSLLCNYSTFETLLRALYKDVKFMETRKNQLNIDAAYGLTLTEANLISIVKSRNIKYLDGNLEDLISEIRQLSKKTRNYVGGHLASDRDRKFSKVFMNVELWHRPTARKNASLLTVRLPDPNLIGSRAYDFMTSGTPNEVDSDYCLSQLTEEYLTGAICKLSSECAEILLRNDNSRGYALTHRLLIIQAATVLKCEEHETTNFEKLIDEYCGRIYQDLRDLEASNFPLVAQDLVMEEIFVCGMEGYSEFLTDHYKHLILSWPHSIGCFSSRGFRLKHRRKKSSDPMDYGCDNHTCGVAAATLSLLIRECLENFVEIN